MLDRRGRPGVSKVWFRRPDPLEGVPLSLDNGMLKRLIIALLVCAALVASVRPGMAVVGDSAPKGHAAGMEMAHHPMAAPCEDENSAGNHMPPSAMGCVAMMSGCFPPAVRGDLVHVARSGAGVRWTPWSGPAEDLVPVTVAPDLRPPRATL